MVDTKLHTKQNKTKKKKMDWKKSVEIEEKKKFPDKVEKIMQKPNKFHD